MTGTPDAGAGGSTSDIAILGLGGTIAMRPSGAGAVPSLAAEDLVELLPADASGRVAHVDDFRQVPGAHLALDDLVALAVRIDELARQGLAKGFVVVQGTDTIEETVIALEILRDGPEPVVVTGAMRHAGQISPDGAANVANALCTAAAPDAQCRGALVCFNDEIHSAWAVQKTAATNPAAFSSPGFGPVGHVIESRARFFGPPDRRFAGVLEPGAVTPARVAILTASLGEGPDLVNAVRDSGYRGLVVQATGAGHLPATWVEPLAGLAAEMPVVLATRVSRGPVLSNTYAFEGSESDLISKGLIPAGFLCASKARILLSMAIGASLGLAESRQVFRPAQFDSGP